eukprot:CAMPEP_0115005050 /NCGR_PEP_ID=MMETSP0216-20121206/19620_1 /TAXON_ID=223996 /ORGANISM="Protocruzia adherens, Strain Boccale" /LENGTH=765 /DNA_ID=CAMNT_0002371261 /DNA_START=187 /DNA_END=2484 /DNA_ORIENTATION=-
MCRACAADGDCSGNTPQCNTTTGACQAEACTMSNVATKCTDSAKPVCNTSTGECMANKTDCTDNASCNNLYNSTGALGYCNTSNSNTCELSCTTANAATLCTGTKVCNTSTLACVDNTCTNDASCDNFHDGSTVLPKCTSDKCVAAAGACQSSNVSTVCTDSTKPVCNTSNNTCVANTCSTHANCAGIHDGTNALDACVSDKCVQGCTAANAATFCSDAAKPYCNTTTKQCVAATCTVDSGCTPLAKGDMTFDKCMGGKCRKSCAENATNSCQTGDVCKASVCVDNKCAFQSDCAGVGSGSGTFALLAICQKAKCVKDATCTTATEAADCLGIKDDKKTPLNKCVSGKCALPSVDCTKNSDCASYPFTPICTSSKCARCANKDECATGELCDSKGHCVPDFTTAAGEATDLKNNIGSKTDAEVKTAVDKAVDAVTGDVPSTQSQQIMDDLAAAVKTKAANPADKAAVTSTLESLNKIGEKPKHLTKDSLDTMAETLDTLATAILGSGTATVSLDGEESKLGSALASIVAGAKDSLDTVAEQEAQFMKVNASIAQVGRALLKGVTKGTAKAIVNDTVKAAFVQRDAADFAGTTTCPGSTGTTGAGCVKISDAIAAKLTGCSGAYEFQTAAKTYNAYASEASSTDKINAGTQSAGFVCSTDGSAVNVTGLASGKEIEFTLTAETGKYVDANSCRYWDTTTEAWSTTGLTGVAATDKKSVTCKTTHLTDFSTSDDSTAPTTTTPTDTTSANFAAIFNPLLVLLAIFAF